MRLESVEIRLVPMIQRCHNSNHKQYDNYGGRGIFWSFVQDMGDRPEGYSIDRKNNDGPYEPDNCRWATDSQQMQNRRWGGPERNPVTGQWLLKENR